MEKNYMFSDSLMELEFLSNQKTDLHYHENFELLYVMIGTLMITVEEEEFILEPGDMLIVNVNRNHCYSSPGEVFIGRFSISYTKIRELLGQSTILFWCNSVVDKSEAFEELRSLIGRIFSQTLQNENSKIYQNSLYYQLLTVLTRNFLLTSKDIRYENERNKGDNRIQEVFAYIRTNYRNNINLQDLADHLYLSPTYLSKYIKRKCNVNFIELMNAVRLGHAMEELMHTDSSIMKIAMDNGFASVAAYNKAFKETYETTPSEFRRKIHQKRPANPAQEASEQIRIQKKVEAYLVQNPVPEETSKEALIRNLVVDIHDAAEESPIREWDNYCGCMINAGTALDISKSAFQEQIVSAKERMGIRYVRFWDIYAPEMYLDIHAPKEQMHFGPLDIVLDFLIKHNLKPYMELGFKPLRLLKTTMNALKEVPRDQDFHSDTEMRECYLAMMEHFLKRYGAEEVQTWYFEYWEKGKVEFQELSYGYKPMSDDGHRRYFEEFTIIAEAFRSLLPEVQIGGGGFPLRHYGKKGFLNLLLIWKEYKELPDFISLNCYPYQQEKEGNAYYEKKSMDADFVLHSLEIAREAMKEAAFPAAQLHVSEYSMTLSNRNAVNDSCIKGAFLVVNAIACMQAADLMSHWLFTDIYADFRDTQDLLFGGCGIITKSGIPKPGFYAFEFLNKLYKKVLVQDRHCLVTENGRGAYRMVCHNCKPLNYNYYMSEENEIHIKDIPYMMDDREMLTIRLQLKSVKNGVYQIKQNRINQEYGSIQDEWNELNMESELSVEEQEYLTKISTPKLTIQNVAIANHQLELEIKLKPNEIQYLYVGVR